MPGKSRKIRLLGKILRKLKRSMIVHIVNTNTVAKKCALSVLKIYMKNYLPKYDCNHNVLNKFSGTVVSK